MTHNAESVADERCPGCANCGDECDVWQGYHLWVEYDSYSECDLCGARIDGDPHA